MGTLWDTVVQGLETSGYRAEEERGALAVVDPEGLKYVVRIDEQARVVRSEVGLHYPVDDFVPELARALGYLNRRRSGVAYVYRESRRDLIAQACWSSLNLDPTPNQLHLLIGLLRRAHGLDQANLQQVAEGDAGWEAVVHDEDPPRTPTSRLPKLERSDAPQALRPGQSGNRWEEFQSTAGGVAREAPSPLEAATTRLAARPPSQRLSPSEQPTQTVDRGTGRLSALEESGADLPVAREAVHLAVTSGGPPAEEPVEDAPPPPPPGKRALVVVVLVVLGLLGIGLVVPGLNPWGGPGADGPGEVHEAVARRDMEAGRELLVEELEDPLDDDEEHQRNVLRSLEALGADARETLETVMLQSSAKGAPVLAYEVWEREGHSSEVSRLRLLRRLQTRRKGAEPLLEILSAQLRDAPPNDEALIEALDWAKGPTWRLLIDLLGRPGDGAEARADALRGQLDAETRDLTVLRALLETGAHDSGALASVVAEEGLDWLKGPGQEAVLSLATDFPQSLAPILYHDDSDLALEGVRLFQAVGTPEAALVLADLLDDARVPLDLRVFMAQTLGSIRAVESAWPLVRVAYRLRRDASSSDLHGEIVLALQSLPNPDAAELLGQRLDPEVSPGERGAAVYGLELQCVPASVRVLLDRGVKDDSWQIRRYVLGVLLRQRSVAEGVLSRRITQLREIARTDPHPQVREAAQRLYDSLIGR